MSTLTAADVLKVAHLARLAIDEQAIPKYVQTLSSIMNLVAQLEQVDTTTVMPMAHPLDAKQRLRSDKVAEANQRELFQSIAPAVAAGLYLVPQVIE